LEHRCRGESSHLGSSSDELIERLFTGEREVTNRRLIGYDSSDDSPADERLMIWSSMTSSDLVEVNDIAGRVHVDHPEDAAVFAERLELYPAGCFSLRHTDKLVGYVISHPWHRQSPPPLNTLLLQMPVAASTYYIHDIALLPEARGSGMASVIVPALVDAAKSQSLPSLSLVAVNQSVVFWERHKFRVLVDGQLDEKLRSYEDARFMVRDL
jgi:GNAT superfamily N-acetyltransferase